MEIFTPFIPLIVTILVPVFTGLIKKLQAVNLSGNRVIYLRAIATLFSFCGVVLTGVLDGTSVSELLVGDTLTIIIETIIVMLASTTVYLAQKK